MHWSLTIGLREQRKREKTLRYGEMRAEATNKLGANETYLPLTSIFAKYVHIQGFLIY